MRSGGWAVRWEEGGVLALAVMFHSRPFRGATDTKKSGCSFWLASYSVAVPVKEIVKFWFKEPNQIHFVRPDTSKQYLPTLLEGLYLLRTILM